MRIAVDERQDDHPAFVDLQQFKASFEDPAFRMSQRVWALVRLIRQLNTRDLTALAANNVERAIARDADHPCFRIAAAGVEASSVLENLNEGIMDRVLGKAGVSDNPQCNGIEMRRSQLIKPPECAPVAVGTTTDQESQVPMILMFKQRVSLIQTLLCL